MASLFERDFDIVYSDKYKKNPGFHFGFTTSTPIYDNLSFESGLLLTKKGAKYETEIYAVNILVKANLKYLQIPLLLKVSGDLDEGVKAYFAAGPYIGLGLSGKIVAEADYYDESDYAVAKISWGNNEYNNDLKRLDLGLSIGGGFEINRVSLGVSYDRGISNISTYQENGTITKNRVLRLSLGYRFIKQISGSNRQE